MSTLDASTASPDAFPGLVGAEPQSAPAAAAVDRQINGLYDALALLRALIDRLPDGTEAENNSVRLAQMAAEKVELAVRDFADL